MSQGFFSTLNSFMHPEKQFKQHKIEILSNSYQKTQNVKRLTNALEKHHHGICHGPRQKHLTPLVTALHQPLFLRKDNTELVNLG
jgi:hypothetical protein